MKKITKEMVLNSRQALQEIRDRLNEFGFERDINDYETKVAYFKVKDEWEKAKIHHDRLEGKYNSAVFEGAQFK